MRPHLFLCLTLLVVLTVATPAQAQRWTGALKAGSAISQFSGETITNADFEPRVGLVGGVSVGLDFGTGFALLSEAIYARRGAYFDILLNDRPTRIRSDLTYLEIPLLAQYRLDTGGYVHPKIFAGPMMAFLLDSRIEFRDKQSDLTQIEEDDSIEDRDFAIVFGAGFEIEVSDQRLSFEARAALGRADITKPDPDLGNPELHNTGIMILVGIVF